MANRVHAYFTASPHFPADIPAAWEDGKKRLRQTLNAQLTVLELLTLEDYCHATGSDLLTNP